MKSTLTQLVLIGLLSLPLLVDNQTYHNGPENIAHFTAWFLALLAMVAGCKPVKEHVVNPQPWRTIWRFLSLLAMFLMVWQGWIFAALVFGLGWAMAFGQNGLAKKEQP